MEIFNVIEYAPAIILIMQKIVTEIESIKIILFNHSNEKFLVNNGDRIAQMVLMPVLKFEFEETKDLPDTLRGSGGFGSTGKK